MIDYSDYIFRSGLSVRQSGNKFRANCPLCDDITKRLWFLPTNDGNYICKCFNDGCIATKATNILGFLKLYNPTLAEELDILEKKKYFESFKNNNGKVVRPDYKKSTIAESNKDIKFVSINKLNKNIFKPITQYKFAIDYCINRHVPEAIYSKWLYVEEYSGTDFDDSIVMPFIRNSDNKLTGFSSRSLKTKKFIINLFSESAYKIYNLYNIDYSKPVYIFESIFDSLYIDNSIALCGASLPTELLCDDKIKYPVFCFDYDSTGLNRSIEYLHLGYNVFILPDRFQKKVGSKIDMNEVVCENNLDQDDVEKIVLSNIYYKNDIVKVFAKLRKNRWVISDHNKNILGLKVKGNK